jgi:DNA-binding MarR family transcriptional regulator
MSSQVLSAQSTAVRAFIGLLRAHAEATRTLSAQLVADHGLTINDYEVLLRLARAEDRRMRRVDLAEEVVLTASGITRLLEGLEREGLVERASCEHDRRVVYAVLTPAGLDKLRAASESHVVQIETFFAERFSPSDIEQVARLLEQATEPDPELDCTADEAAG